ncbi:hypothetical protein ADIS_3946 [Lunatimonas lonarensis]|uniref:Uncharacterized protein n=1 Tax=Lunatimonas lonarensis TaxID=1232681 RepID=R7ZN93_9BACT|nr:DUF6702 family protein [Lunatimonas lonarensis]EON75543.1 hypothetical protein ADIS_3946 [Lunatimonas lonarensis]
MPTLLVSIYCLFYSLLPHPFYISLTDMVYNRDKNSIEIAQKIFWDDLEVALGQVSQSKVDFLRPKDPKALNELAKNYLFAHNQIYINGNLQKIHYLGFEIEEDAAWFYMEIENVPSPKVVRIKNTILLADFPTQQNIVNFYLDKSPKSIITSRNKQEGELRY